MSAATVPVSLVEALKQGRVKPGSLLLMPGFGGGLTFAPLLERGATITGVDRAPDMVEAARSRFGAEVAEIGRAHV